MRTDEARRLHEADALDERYGKPLEAEHRGEYIAVAPDGRTLVGPTVLAVAQQAHDAFGPGYVVFKLGERAVGRWRCAASR